MEQLNFITNLLGIKDTNSTILDVLDAGTLKAIIACFPGDGKNSFFENSDWKCTASIEKVYSFGTSHSTDFYQSISCCNFCVSEKYFM